MAALDFPDTPVVGDIYGSSGTLWRWDGARWATSGSTSGGSWTTLVLGAGFVAYGTPYEAPSWRLRGDRIETRGMLKFTAAHSAGGKLLASTGMPVIFPQIAGSIGWTNSTNGDRPAQVRMALNGDLSIYVNSGNVPWPIDGWITLDGVSYATN